MAKRKDGKPNPRGTDLQVFDRILQVQQYLLNGYTRSEVIRFITSDHRVGEDQVDKYIASARMLNNEINKVTAEENLTLLTKNMWSLYRSCINSDNLSEANKVLMNIAKRRGLDQITLVIEDKRELQGLSDEELEAAIYQKPNDT